MDQQEEGKDPRLNGKGWRLMFFFSPSLDMCKEEGKRVSFRVKTFFSLLIG
jgi:hypothetical protein